MTGAISPQFSSAGLFVPTVPEPRRGAKGSLGPLGRLRILFTFARNPLEGFAGFQFEKPYDQFNFFGRQSLLVNDPALIRYFFVENAGNYRHGDLRQGVLKPVLREGLLTAEGERWRRTRRALAPVFTPRSVHGFARSMRASAERFADAMEAGAFQVAPMMSELTYNVLSETLFSGELSGDSSAVLADVALFLEALGKPDPLDILRAPAWLPRLTKMRGHSSISRLRSRVRQLVDARAASLAAGEPLPHDFATLLLMSGRDSGEPFTHDEIEDNLITFIGAGHETTARGLAWTLFLLSNDEQARRRAEAEIAGLDLDAVEPQEWVDRLPFVRACFEEALRLYPPAAMIARMANAADSFDGISVPADGTVIINSWILHRHRLYWERPDAFDPDRFMPPRRAGIDRFAYLPFGVGPHVCIGASFAMQEAVIILATLLKRFRFDYAGTQAPWPVMRVTIKPHNDMPMRISRR